MGVARMVDTSTLKVLMAQSRVFTMSWGSIKEVSETALARILKELEGVRLREDDDDPRVWAEKNRKGGRELVLRVRNYEERRQRIIKILGVPGVVVLYGNETTQYGGPETMVVVTLEHGLRLMEIKLLDAQHNKQMVARMLRGFQADEPE